MEYTETRVETREVTVRTKLTCDLCGREQEGYNKWTKEPYKVVDTTVKMTIGQSFPEGGSGKHIIVDICDTCFRDKLLKWLESQGAHPREKPWDW